MSWIVVGDEVVKHSVTQYEIPIAELRNKNRNRMWREHIRSKSGEFDLWDIAEFCSLARKLCPSAY